MSNRMWRIMYVPKTGEAGNRFVFVVIPSSIHEVIILPMDDNVDKDELEGIIREVNTGQVAPEERLSYHAYQYDSGKHALMRMDKKEELAIQQQQDNQQNNHMHTRRSR